MHSVRILKLLLYIKFISLQVFDFAKTIGYTFTLLDIGGGFLGERNASLDNVAEVINASLEKYFPDTSIRVIAEPGQYYVASAYTLACNIHSVRTTTVKDATTLQNKVHHMYYLNDGIFGSFFCVWDDNRPLFPTCLSKYEDGKEELFSSSLWGYTPNSNDQVKLQTYLLSC